MGWNFMQFFCCNKMSTKSEVQPQYFLIKISPPSHQCGLLNQYFQNEEFASIEQVSVIRSGNFCLFPQYSTTVDIKLH